MAAITLDELNHTSDAEFAQALTGTYENSPWIVEAAASRRPFATLAALKRALVEVVRQAPREQGHGVVEGVVQVVRLVLGQWRLSPRPAHGPSIWIPRVHTRASLP